MIKEATTLDIPFIQHIVKVTWPITYGKILSNVQINYMLEKIYANDSLTEQMNNGHHFYLLMEDSVAIGFIDVEKISKKKTKLHKIYLLPDHQGKNYGKVLMGFAIEKAKENNSDSLQLNVNRYNLALNFYLKQGFKIVEEVDIPIGNGYFMNDYIMEKAL
ncbi:MAG TPA: GNAT family N-acetyltransferase [Arachidicoccus soli]|nr:GNAT family N-acetyltransferase [Arachidicoccus soli]